MNNSVSPFEIHLIVDLISHHLSKKDIANCILVSSTFYAQFKGFHWREVKISAAKRRYSNKDFSLEYQKAILENGHLVRKLSILGGLLESPGKGYRNRLTVALSNLPSLSRLCLVDDDVGATCLEYGNLLKRLPRNLQHLRLDWSILLEVDDDEESDCDNDDDNGKDLEDEKDDKDEDGDTGNDGEKPSSNNIEWPGQYPHLKSIDMTVRLYGGEGTTLFPFLQRCPALEEVKIVQTNYSIFKTVVSLLSDTRLFPTLTKVSLESFAIESSSCLSLISGIKGRIKAFLAGKVTFLPSSLFIGAPAAQWAETLEVLQFRDEVRVSSEGIELILTMCSNLKTFSVESKPNNSDSAVGVASGLNAWRNVQNGSHCADWVCLQLEDLEITFLDVRNRNYGQKEEMNTNAGINRAYKQIGRLSKLRRLRLGWHPNQIASYQANTDMSITSGLEQMEGSKELRELDITCIDKANVRQEEVAWMAENWPKLRRTKGLLKLNDLNFITEDEIVVTADDDL
ncbi:hypothetical protein BGX26_000376, partial [Mortierella sp. AD094]